MGGGPHAGRHLRAWTGARDADVLGIWDPDAAHAAAAAELARGQRLGAARPYPSIAAMIADPAIGALWLCGPLETRVAVMDEIADAIIRARGALAGLACDAPLAADVPAAQRMVELAAHTGLKHCYLEPHAFQPDVTGTREALWKAGAPPPDAARARETHPGPGRPADVWCHATLAVRYLLTPPGESLGALRARRVTGRQEDRAASLTIDFETPDGRRVVGEAVASWGADAAAPAHGGEPGLAGADAHGIRALRGLDEPLFTFADGLDVVRLVTAGSQSVAAAATLDYPPPTPPFVPGRSGA